jgi:hypothetical protein
MSIVFPSERMDRGVQGLLQQRDDVGPAQVGEAWTDLGSRVKFLRDISPWRLRYEALRSPSVEDREAVGADVRDAYAAARELREQAEADAAALVHEAEATADVIRASANRYATKRLHDVELLAGKAKRSLSAAEERSRLMLETARADAEKLLIAAREQAGVLVASSRSMPGDVSAIDLRDEGERRIDPFATELDRLLKEALAHALDLPVDDPYPNRGPGRVRR